MVSPRQRFKSRLGFQVWAIQAVLMKGHGNSGQPEKPTS
ncbi:hypothetical protein DNTS_026926 [Danionella cerebrum]|uniref:Uncharacterized protein n=1 Tax=Danionella cerebrum TaxID=2873325 RepID=A0A553QKG8_9TELE|nr:hypothetical protein DNTS_026926 [Danionella translucida]